MTNHQKQAAHDLCKFLKAHENEIALQEADFGELTSIFVELFGRRPLAKAGLTA